MLRSGISPSLRSVGDVPDETRAEFLAGVDMLNFKQATIKPQQLHVADTIGLGRKFTGILMPRRTAKTTSIFEVLIGRCLSRPGYIVGFTTGINALKARTRFRQDVMPNIYRRHPILEGSGVRKFQQTAGMEQIEFENGSYFMVGKPHEDWFRSEAFDVIFIDEAGEADQDKSESILVGALPTMDTRPGSQIILAGTAADFRTGSILWDTLQREDDHRVALLGYGVDQGTSAEDLADWDSVEPLLRLHHPGIGTLTTMEDVRDNFEHMTPARFAREYLGLFGWTGEVNGIIDPAKWHQAEVKTARYPTPPAKFGLAMAASPNQQAGSIVAAWRVDGIAHVLVLASEPGVRWMAGKAAELSRRYRVPVAHDSIGVVLVHAEEMAQMRPRPTMTPFTMRQIITSAAKFAEALDSGRLRHYGQDVLTSAALSARRRSIGESGWGFGRRHPDQDITALEAAAIALRAYDELPVRQTVRVLRPTG